MNRTRVKWALQQTGLFPTARSVYRTLNRSIRANKAREIAFYKSLLPENSLCFDIGANLGQKTEVLVACGARVICVEPNEMCLPTLNFQFANRNNVRLVTEAVGSTSGFATMHVDGTAATASLRPEWNKMFGQGSETVPQVVPITTLDVLISKYGRPDFVKIDVEGFEVEVLRGLSEPVPLVSFEFHADQTKDIREALLTVQRLGRIKMKAANMDCEWISEPFLGIDQCVAELRARNAKGDLFVWVEACQ